MRLAAPVAFAVIVAANGWSAPAVADDFGCEVLLCLSNPGDPMEFGACISPISRLYQILATGRGFPVCSEGDVIETETHGKLGSEDYRVTMTYTHGSQQTYWLGGTMVASPEIGGVTAPEGVVRR